VRFLGRLTREEVWDTLAQVDVVVVPTLWYETFSFIISEAFIAGVPVIASRLGPVADRVRDGVDGLLVPPGDVSAWRAALQRLVEEPNFLARLRANVRPPMTLNEHVGRIEALYAQLAGNSQDERRSKTDR
jgi:glycosyltransferase involved in cell wall biosynthesis